MDIIPIPKSEMKRFECSPERYLNLRHDWRDNIPGLACVVDYLNDYLDIAISERPTDKQLFDLANKTAKYAASAIRRNEKIVGGQKKWTEVTKGDPKEEIYLDIIKGQEQYTVKLKHIVDMANKAVSNKNRLEALNATEWFVNMHHNDGMVLTQWACNCDEAPGNLCDNVAKRVLDCLAK